MISPNLINLFQFNTELSVEFQIENEQIFGATTISPAGVLGDASPLPIPHATAPRSRVGLGRRVRLVIPRLRVEAQDA